MKLIILTIIALLVSPVSAQFTKLPLPAEVFKVDGHDAFVIHPEKQAAGRPWVWYAPTVESVPRDFHKFYFERFLAKGIAVAGYNQGEVRGSEKTSAKFTGFYDAMVAKGFSKKPILLGQSRGGFMMLNWAFRNPSKLGAFAGIYPVCNITSWPLVRSKPAVLREYGMTEQEILKQLDKLNPPENLAGLAKNKVPFFLLHGDQDKIVPYEQNSLLIKNNYEQLGGKVSVKIVPGGAHTVDPAYFTDQALVDFVISCAKQQNGN